MRQIRDWTDHGVWEPEGRLLGIRDDSSTGQISSAVGTEKNATLSG